MAGANALEVGAVVAGKYRLEREIGSGGMGVVFSAVHVHLDQRVALKFLLHSAAIDADLVERFWREARAAVKIQSEHVARVMDIGELESGQPYMVMEYLEGDDLESIVRKDGPLRVGDAIRYLLQACEALAEVHAQGIVHRDVKPANLFLTARADGTNIVKLLDFGISKASPAWAVEDGGRSLTNTTAVIGSPRYMSPEQLRSSRDVDARTDIWALGVTLFELLGGTSPFARGTMPEVCASILKDEPLSLTGLRPEVPSDLEAVIRCCLAKQSEGRYRNVAELALALRPFGPLGIIDISIERVVGIIQMSMMSSISPPPVPAGAVVDDSGRSLSGQHSRSGTRPPMARSQITPSPIPRERIPVTRDRISAVRPPASADSTGETAAAVMAPTRTAVPGPTAVAAPTAPALPRTKTAQGVSENELEVHYLSKLGPRNQFPHLAMDPAQIGSLALDHRAGFLLSCIDGASTLDDVLDVSGMKRLETLRLLCDLIDLRVISLGRPTRTTT